MTQFEIIVKIISSKFSTVYRATTCKVLCINSSYTTGCIITGIVYKNYILIWRSLYRKVLTPVSTHDSQDRCILGDHSLPLWVTFLVEAVFWIWIYQGIGKRAMFDMFSWTSGVWTSAGLWELPSDRWRTSREDSAVTPPLGSSWWNIFGRRFYGRTERFA